MIVIYPQYDSQVDSHDVNTNEIVANDKGFLHECTYIDYVIANAQRHTYLVRQSRASLVLFMLSQVYGGPCSPPQEPGPGGGQPDVLFLWLKQRGQRNQLLIIITLT